MAWNWSILGPMIPGKETRGQAFGVSFLWVARSCKSEDGAPTKQLAKP